MICRAELFYVRIADESRKKTVLHLKMQYEFVANYVRMWQMRKQVRLVAEKLMVDLWDKNVCLFG